MMLASARRCSFALALASLGLVAVFATRAARADDQVIHLTGDVPMDDSSFLFLPFEVPAGTAEIEVKHSDLSSKNILDWGLNDPNGYRGWGGGKSADAIVGVDAASPSYAPGPLPAGTWQVVIGKAQILDPPGQYDVTITLRTEPTLAPQTERAPYEPPAPLSSDARWYAGDLHMHTIHSDGTPTVEELAVLAEQRGLDFIEVSDHNNVTQLDYYKEVQARHPTVLLIPGEEWTTYEGHANAIGVTRVVPFTLGVDGVTANVAADDTHAQGGLFSINHPTLDLGDACIGCAWTQPIDPFKVDAVEIENGAYSKYGQLFYEKNLAFWDGLLDSGAHIAAVGGSDDHKGAHASGFTESVIGRPTTMVYASELSVAAIVDGIKHHRTVVKLDDVDDPMIELRADGELPDGGTIEAASMTLSVHVEGAMGGEVRLYKNGAALADVVAVDSGDFTHDIVVDAPPSGEDRYRAELSVGGQPAAVTSHVWIARPATPPDAGVPDAGAPDAGLPDAGLADAGVQDAGVQDAGVTSPPVGASGGCAIAAPGAERGRGWPALALALSFFALGWTRRRL
ncbi:MAG: PHP domain-containing protein [Myxococcales bacterium]|nr:PHP domain-containing protein [Myxococcales bacterium]